MNLRSFTVGLGLALAVPGAERQRHILHLCGVLKLQPVVEEDGRLGVKLSYRPLKIIQND